MPASVRRNISETLHIQEGTFPFRYLGIPLTSKKLRTDDLTGLLEKITGRVKHWTSKMLSYAGKVELIRSVINSIELYWMQQILLPAKWILMVEKVARDFLWSSGSGRKSSSPISWSTVCSPKEQGGLGRKKLSSVD